MWRTLPLLLALFLAPPPFSNAAPPYTDNKPPVGRPIGNDSIVVLDRIIAVVNRDVITWSELYRAMEAELDRRAGAVPEAEKKRIIEQSEAVFLQSMVDARLQLQEAERLGMKATPEEVDAAMEDVKNRFSMDDSGLEKAIKGEGFSSIEDYRKTLLEQITISRLVEQEVRSKLAPEKKEQGEGLYRLRQIFFRASEDEDALRSKVAAVVEKLKAGEDFEALARDRSEDSTAELGGDLGFVKKSYLAREFAEALEPLKPGNISEPFRSEKGVHIIKLDGVKSDDETYLEERFRKQYKEWLSGLREKAFIEIRL